MSTRRNAFRVKKKGAEFGPTLLAIEDTDSRKRNRVHLVEPAPAETNRKKVYQGFVKWNTIWRKS